MAESEETVAAGGPKPARSLVAGAQLGRFTLRRPLGEGGMGVVWAAHDPDLDREIAIKVLRHVNASEALRKRLLREARAMARLKHPNVLTVYEVGSSGDIDFIAMELVDGVSLDQWLTQEPLLDDIWRALLAAGRGLAAAHAAGLVHRDFKPHNVLRSRDGRVLVTDFGLARGLGDDGGEAAKPTADIALETTLTPSRMDSVLDSPLTQTGTMIGTPAYMAPEQFHGAAPDPRTDQFAYCISAWQALTGARPFAGETIADLHAAALAGVDGVVADLPKPVRAVLARGLARDPAARWPDMDALLDALERASKPRRRMWPLVAGLGAIALAINIFVFTRSEPKKPPAVCAPASEVFAEAWSDAARDELAKTVPEPTVTRVASAFEQFRTKWTASYQDACNAPPSKRTDARLACLRSVRDQTVLMRLVVQQAKQLDGIDVHGALPNLASCNTPSPIAQPEFPTDERRQVVLGVLARTMTLRASQDLDASAQQLVADAKASGWQPLESMVQVIAGNAYLARGAYTQARVLFRAALKTATMRFNALAHLGLLEASVRELENPADDKEIAKEITYARSAVRGAGNDPLLVGSVAELEAEAQTAQALWGKNKQAYGDALELALEARKAFETAGDARRAAQAAVLQARLLVWRESLDDALFVVRSAQEGMTNTGLEPLAALDELRAEIAFAKGDFREAHDRYDRLARARTFESPAKHGRVVDEKGNGVRAVVVAWGGALHGDPARLYTDPRFGGEVIETAADGTFELHSGPVVIAQAGAMRSQLATAKDGVELTVKPIEEARGTVDGPHAAVDIVAEQRWDGGVFYVHAPVDKSGAYQLRGIAAASSRTILLRGPGGDGTRSVGAVKGKLAWPNGGAIEVIVRAKQADGATAWVLPAGYAPKTRAQAELATTVATAELHAIGADATDAGRDIYATGDVHAILINNPPGDADVCVSLGAQFRCQTVRVTDDARVVPVLFKTDE